MKWIKVSNDLETPYESSDWFGSEKKYFELGLELVTTHLEVKRMKNQGLIDADDIIIVSTDRKFLYENEFNVIEYKDFLKIYPTKEPNNYLDLTKNAHKIYREKVNSGNFFNKDNKYNYWDDDIDLLTNINYDDLDIKDEKYFVVHVRIRKFCPNRNISLEYWKKLINQLVKNYHIKCYVFGEKTEELINNRTILGVTKLKEYASLLHNEKCQFFVGSTSGGSMITQLCCLENCPAFIIETSSFEANTKDPMHYHSCINFAAVDFQIIKNNEIDNLFETIRTKMKTVKELKQINKVKIDVHVICYNEETIIPFVIDYYKLFANTIYVYDNNSTDSSIELFKQLPNVKIIKFDTNNENNEQLKIDIRNTGWKRSIGKADYVFICDMDEILYSPRINEEFLKLKNDGITVCKFNLYDMYSEKIPTYKEGKLFHQLSPTGCDITGWKAPLVFNPNEITEINYIAGKHDYNPVGNIKINNTTENINNKKSFYNMYGMTRYINGDIMETNILLLHLKHIDIEKNIEKNRIYNERLAMNNIINKWSHHYAYSKEEYTRLFYQEFNRSINVNDFFKKKRDTVTINKSTLTNEPIYNKSILTNEPILTDKTALTPYYNPELSEKSALIPYYNKGKNVLF